MNNNDNDGAINDEDDQQNNRKNKTKKKRMKKSSQIAQNLDAITSKMKDEFKDVSLTVFLKNNSLLKQIYIFIYF
jgi:hypothetical protein